jgi:hypothetical protein
MIQLVSGLAEPDFRGRIVVIARIRAGLRFKRFLCFVLIGVKMFSRTHGRRVPQAENHCSRDLALRLRLDCQPYVPIALPPPPPRKIPEISG